MKRLLPLLLAIVLAACSGAQPNRPMYLYCGMVKEKLVERVTAIFVAQGYQITFASAEAGTVQAEYNEGGGFMVDSKKRRWSVAARHDTLIINTQYILRGSGAYGSESVYNIDNHNLPGNTAQWFAPIIEQLNGLCVPPTPLKENTNQ